MKKIVHHYPVSSHRPGKMCTAGPSTLLYCDWSDPLVIRWLDCSSSTPQPVAELVTQQGSIYKMCCIEDEGKSWVVIIDILAIRCYNRDSGELVWKVEGKLPGMGEQMCPGDITTDRLGHLFVADFRNNCNCIHKFSLTGEYLGVLVKEGEQGLGEPRCVRWNDATSSLVIAHKKDGGYYISVVSFP